MILAVSVVHFVLGKGSSSDIRSWAYIVFELLPLAAAMDFGKEIVNPSGGRAVDWDRSYFVVQILLDSFGHTAGIVVDNMALAVGKNSTQSFVVVSDMGMADYDRLIDDSSENQSEPRAPFARCIHHSSSNLVV